MSKRRNNTLRNLNSAANSGMKVADKAASGLFRWMVTNHSGVQFYLPTGLGFFGSIRHMLMQLLMVVVGACAGAILMFVLVAFVLPALIVGHF